jgi:HSP20 family protein
MALARSDPFRELVQLQDQLFKAFDSQYSNRRQADEGLSGAWQPPVDVYEDANGILLKVELPEIDPKEVEIQVEGNSLTIRGERKLENVDKREGYQRIERVYGAFSRSFTLPQTVDVDHISADGKDGVLRIFLPKRAETKPRQIKVQPSSQTPQLGAQPAHKQ